jgi:hypothetical protein
MSKTTPAFPTAQYADGVRPSGFDNGMTLRDYFAAKAMQELIGVLGLTDATKRAYEWADAMMKAREA